MPGKSQEFLGEKLCQSVGILPEFPLVQFYGAGTVWSVLPLLSHIYSNKNQLAVKITRRSLSFGCICINSSTYYFVNIGLSLADKNPASTASSNIGDEIIDNMFIQDVI